MENKEGISTVNRGPSGSCVKGEHKAGKGEKGLLAPRSVYGRSLAVGQAEHSLSLLQLTSVV